MFWTWRTDYLTRTKPHRGIKFPFLFALVVTLNPPSLISCFWKLQTKEKQMRKKAGRKLGLTDEDLISIVHRMSNNRDSKHVLEEVSLSDVALEERKEKASNPLFLYRYE